MTDLETNLPPTRLFRRLEEGRPAIGSYVFNGPREIVEILGDNGVDYVVVDMMISPTSWAEAANLASIAYQFGMTPWIRIQSYPWSGGSSLADPRLPADVLRALSIGYQVVQISTDGPEQIEPALHPRLNHHRRIHLGGFDRAEHTADLANPSDDTIEALVESRTLIVPSIESAQGLSRFGEIIALPGLRVVKFGMGDLLQILGHKGDVNHAEVRRFVRDSVARANDVGVRVVVNMPGTYTEEGVHSTASWMWEAGVSVIEIPYYTVVLNRFYHDSMRRLRTIGA